MADRKVAVLPEAGWAVDWAEETVGASAAAMVVAKAGAAAAAAVVAMAGARVGAPGVARAAVTAGAPSAAASKLERRWIGQRRRSSGHCHQR